MDQLFTVKAVARYVATVAFSLFSYAVMAQSAPSADACGHVLSSFQKRLYNHYLAGPDSLRNFVFSTRGIRLLDIHDADAWARSIDGQTCPSEPLASTSGAVAGPMPRQATQIAAADEGPDGCTTNVLDVMHCTAHGERTRAAVIAELRNAQAAGELAGVGELADARVASVVPANATVAATRAVVRQELALARSAHELQFGER